jgi:RNA recognition motif-containing protein
MTDATRLKSTIYIGSLPLSSSLNSTTYLPLTHIGGLDNSITKPLLHTAFLPFGEIVEVNLPGSENERGHRGFGYVEFETAEDAAAAIDNMDQATLAGRTLSVAIAKPQTKEAGNILGSKVAVWEQVRCSRGGEGEEVWAGLMRCAGNRKSGSGSTRSPMRTVRQQTQRRRRLWLKLSIRCKAWRDSMLLGQSRRARNGPDEVGVECRMFRVFKRVGI